MNLTIANDSRDSNRIFTIAKESTHWQGNRQGDKVNQ